MKPLSLPDELFLFLEKRQQPMHVAGLQLFRFPEDAGPKYMRELAAQMRDHSTPVKPFDQCLTYRFGYPHWIEDENFDIDHHFRHEALPKPGRIRELLARVSAEHSNMLDRARPLWEAHLIEGIQGKRFALYTKVHHAMMDGMSAMRMGMRALSHDPAQRDLPPVWAFQRPRGPRAQATADSTSGFARMSTTLGKQVATVPALVREVQSVLRKAKSDPDYVSIFQAPHALLNESITGSRRFAAQSYSLERVRRIGSAFDCTVNDVVLAVCGSALREYLGNRNALPDRPLIALVPMSLRQDDSAEGNQVATILANLGTHLDDPAARIGVVKASVEEAKARYSQMSPAEILNFTALTLAPTFINLLTGLVPGLQAFNLIISNVPGPREPLYWNGARLEGMYPVSFVLDRSALNITLTSYCDQLEFGLIGCRRTLPSMQRMLDYLENGIRQLETAAGLD